MSGQSWAVFVGSSLLLALAPGPDILTVMTRSVGQGTRAGIVAALGFVSGLSVHTTLAAVGVAAAIKASPSAFTALRWCGAGYLLYLAVRNAWSKNAFNLEAAGTRRGLWTIFGQSVLMNVLNPKVVLFFLSFFPGFVETRESGARMAPWQQTILLGAVFAACTTVVFVGSAVFAGGLSTWLRRRPEAAPWLKWATSALFVAIALWIFCAKLDH